MNPLEAVRRAFKPGSTASDQSWSIVLLERHHHFLRKEPLREAAQEAYGHSFAPGNADYQVMQSTATFVKVGEDTIHVTQSSQPYEAKPHVMGHGVNHSQNVSWQEHKGYLLLDLSNKTHTREQAYSIVARLAAALLTENVVGLFLPRENEFYPNDGTAKDCLERLAR